MMDTKGTDQDRLFYSFNLDEHVPADHLLRPIDRFLDLSELRRHLIRAGRYHILVAPHQVDLPADSRAGHTDVSLLVADFEPQGYKLVGGRVDYLEHQRAAVVGYRHGAHVINVFSWAATQRSLPGKLTRNGYLFVFWKAGDLQYCAVSDTGWDELLRLVRLLQGLGGEDAR